MKTNFKKVCATLTTVAIIGAISAAVFAADQAEKKAATFNFGDEASGTMQQSVISVDENGNILDQDGNVIGNIEDFSAPTEDMDLKVSFTATDGNETAEGENYSVTITDQDGNILDEDGNIIGNIKDLPEAPEGAEVNATVTTTDGNETAEGENYSLTFTDQDGNILDEDGNIIGNIKDLPEAPEGAKVNPTVTTTDGDETTEGQNAKTITIDGDGNIKDEEGNIIGNISDSL